MSSSRWRVLTAYLPGIASVVNSFQSTEVQMAVYQSLINALDEKTDAEDAHAMSKVRAPANRGRLATDRDVTVSASDSELAYDIVDGESIHSLMGKS